MKGKQSTFSKFFASKNKTDVICVPLQTRSPLADLKLSLLSFTIMGNTHALLDTHPSCS